MARIRILVAKKEEKWINLLTTIVDSEDFVYTENFKKIKSFSNSIILLEGFINCNQINKLKSEILNDNQLKINRTIIFYNLNKDERNSFMQSKEITFDDEKLLYSPFKNSATLVENWCEIDEIKNLWNNFPAEIKKEISGNLEINLYEMIDRVGNLLHFKEINEIRISIIHQNNRMITFSSSMKNVFIPNKYFANIQIKSYDDIILKKGFIINERFIDFELQDEDYNIDVEIYNIENRECVFKDKFIFMKEISLNMNIAGPKITFKDRDGKEIHSIQTYSVDRTSTIGASKHSKMIQYEQIRKNWTGNILRKEQHFFRGFSKKEYKEAMNYFQGLLKCLANCKKEYLYIADPYFFDAKFDIRRFVNYMNIFATVQNKEIRILTCCEVLPRVLKNFRKNNKNKIFKNVIIKSIIDKSKKANTSFHDRWIAADNQEYGFTNSLNNFKNGVSFFKSIEHYYYESETLWNISTNDINYQIEEFRLYE